MKNERKQVYEYEVLKVCEDFTEDDFLNFAKFGEKTNEIYFKVGNKSLTFKNYVGVIKIKNFTIEILPKIDNSKNNSTNNKKWRSVLVEILKECKHLKLNNNLNAGFKVLNHSLLDYYFESFVDSVKQIQNKGLFNQYKFVTNNIKSLKGKLILQKQLTVNHIHKERFYVNYNVYQIDNIYNQILKKALLKTLINSDDNNLKTKIKHLLLEFDQVSDIYVNSKTFEKVKFNRNNKHYTYAIQLSKLILLNQTPDFESGEIDVISIIFDMNKLYENYIFNQIKKLENKKDEIKKISNQSSTSIEFWNNNRLMADILIEYHDNTNLVIDTKWKLLTNVNPNISDVRQMFVYNTHYKANKTLLLYPTNTDNSLLSSKYIPYSNEDYSSLSCQVGTINLIENNKLCSELGEILYELYLKE